MLLFLKRFVIQMNLYRCSLGLHAATVLCLALVASGCGRSGQSSKPPDVDYYTCTMHPSVKSQDPNAKCPICSMDLVPVKKKASPAPREAQQPANPKAFGSTNTTEQPSEFTVPMERQQQIGVTYGKVEKRPLTLAILAVGSVAADTQRRWDYVTRVEGYVQKLFVFSPGESVEPDAPLLTIYSPDLLTAENEFLVLLKTLEERKAQGDPALAASTQGLVDAAKARLRLRNITEAQIGELEKTHKPRETLTLMSPFKGVVQTLSVDQGRHVSVGDRLVTIVDLSLVWVWAQFYETELALVKNGMPVTIRTPAYPDEKFTGKISLIDPFLNGASRTARVRVDVDNPAMMLRPDMYVDVRLTIERGEGLAVPVSAVLPTGLRNIVFVDKGEGRLEPRFVKLGRKYGDVYEVLGGLSEAQRVVTSGNFLIDAEAKVQGALKSW